MKLISNSAVAPADASNNWSIHLPYTKDEKKETQM